MPSKHDLITTKHSPEQCLSVLDEMAAKAKYTLGKMRWGCMAGDHTGYMFVDATDEQDALKFLPPMAKATAKAEEVQKFTPRRLKALPGTSSWAAPCRSDSAGISRHSSRSRTCSRTECRRRGVPSFHPRPDPRVKEALPP